MPKGPFRGAGGSAVNVATALERGYRNVVTPYPKDEAYSGRPAQHGKPHELLSGARSRSGRLDEET